MSPDHALAASLDGAYRPDVIRIARNQHRYVVPIVERADDHVDREVHVRFLDVVLAAVLVPRLVSAQYEINAAALPQFGEEPLLPSVGIALRVRER